MKNRADALNAHLHIFCVKMNKTMPKMHFRTLRSKKARQSANLRLKQSKTVSKICRLTKYTKKERCFCELLRVIIYKLTSRNVDGKVAECYNINV